MCPHSGAHESCGSRQDVLISFSQVEPEAPLDARRNSERRNNIRCFKRVESVKLWVFEHNGITSEGPLYLKLTVLDS